MAWRTAESLKKLRVQINELAPGRSKASDGTIGDSAHASRSSDHNPWVMDGNIGVVTAMDITHDPDHGCDAGKLVNAILNNKDSRIKYIIYDKKIMSSTVKPWKWQPYNGINPHTRHCHISVKPEKSHYDATADWIIEL